MKDVDQSPDPGVAADPADGRADGQVDGQEAEPRPRRRLRLTWRVLVPVVTALAGIMFAMSFVAAQGRDLRADRDLPQLIIDGDARVSEKAAELDALQKEVETLSAANAPDDQRLSTLTAKANNLAGAAARTKVEGPGIEVSLDDSTRSIDSMTDSRITPDDLVVHQQDVQAVVNALWQSGAEAMMIQDQRVISTSAVRCVGNTLILQGRVYSPPYRISAIGDVESMQLGLEFDPTVSVYREYVDAVGLGYDVQTHDSLEFPAYSGTVDFQYASPIR
jgi:uncharacterized protein YlxW (UPF0749 family)